MWWLHPAGYHKMLCFWGLTGVERQAYIRPVGRVAGRARTVPERQRRTGRTGAAKTLVGGISPENSQLSSRPPERTTQSRRRQPDRDDRPVEPERRRMGRRQTGGRPARDARTRADRPLRAASSASWRPAARGSHGSQRRATPPSPLSEPLRDVRTNRPRAPRGTGNESSRLERVPRYCDHSAPRSLPRQACHGARARHG
jgi:hypothetical protein